MITTVYHMPLRREEKEKKREREKRRIKKNGKINTIITFLTYSQGSYLPGLSILKKGSGKIGATCQLPPLCPAAADKFRSYDPN